MGPAIVIIFFGLLLISSGPRVQIMVARCQTWGAEVYGSREHLSIVLPGDEQIREEAENENYLVYFAAVA